MDRPTRPGDEPLNETYALAESIAKILSEKLAEEIIVLDMREVVSYTDWFVIASGRNRRQTASLAQDLRKGHKHEIGATPIRVEGEREGDWILIDYIDVVVHLFTPEARAYYRLDALWGQVPAVEFAS